MEHENLYAKTKSLYYMSVIHRIVQRWRYLHLKCKCSCNLIQVSLYFYHNPTRLYRSRLSDSVSYSEIMQLLCYTINKTLVNAITIHSRFSSSVVHRKDTFQSCSHVSSTNPLLWIQIHNLLTSIPPWRTIRTNTNYSHPSGSKHECALLIQFVLTDTSHTNRIPLAPGISICWWHSRN